MRTELHAGDVLVYIHYLLHWGSSYMREPLRRTVHGGHAIYPYWEDLGFTRHLSAQSRQRFEGWAARTAALKDHTEHALRAVLDRDAGAYTDALETLRPGTGDATKLQLTIWLCKAAMRIHLLKRPDYASLPDEVRDLAASHHSTALNWGPEFAKRFTKPEADRIWEGFGALEDQLLASDDEDHVPGYQTGPVAYSLERMRNCYHRRGLHRQLGARGVDLSGDHERRPCTEPKLNADCDWMLAARQAVAVLCKASPPGWRNGRRTGLKIPGLRSCGFDSHPRHRGGWPAYTRVRPRLTVQSVLQRTVDRLDAKRNSQGRLG